MTYSNSSYMETLSRDPATYNPSGCTKKFRELGSVPENVGDSGPGNNLLDPGEMFFVSACPSNAIVGGDSFTLEVKPSVGVALSLNRRVPNQVRPVNSLPSRKPAGSQVLRVRIFEPGYVPVSRGRVIVNACRS